jgi:hypothetical protein
MDERRRAHERHEVAGHPGEVKVYQPISIRQLSAGGALVEIGVPLQLDSIHEFRLTLGERALVVKGRVVHSHIATVGSDRLTYRTGVEFVDVSDAVAAALAELVDILAAQRLGGR